MWSAEGNSEGNFLGSQILEGFHKEEVEISVLSASIPQAHG
jgi:hypothetical protein